MNFILNRQDELLANKLIEEYLDLLGFENTLKHFRVETGERGLGTLEHDKLANQPILGALVRPADERNEKISLLQQKFLEYMQSGDEQSFMELWDSSFPLKDHADDPTFSQLDFNVHIYFAVYPLQDRARGADAETQRQQLARSLESFKQFLENRGSELCKSPQYLSYYALPYVPDPKTHPSFRDLFTNVWQKSLEERIFGFIGSELHAENLPVLVQLAKNATKQQHVEKTPQVPSVPLQQLEQTQERMSALMSKHRMLQGDYHKLVIVASELVQALTAVLHGETISPSHLVNIVQRLNAFRKDAMAAQNEPTEPASTVVNRPPPIPSGQTYAFSNYAAPQQTPRPILENSVKPENAPAANAATELTFASAGPWELHLNMGAIKQDLASGKKHNAALLHALRCYILGSQNVKIQRQAVSQLIAHDFMGRHGGSLPLDVAAFTLSNEPLERIYKEQMVKLLNAVSSSVQGRSYLLGQVDPMAPASDRGSDLVSEGVSNYGKQLLTAMLSEMKAEHGDTSYRQNLVVTLQKLSLRRAAQTVMNELSTIEWVLDLLDTHMHDAKSGYELSDCSLEYSMALVMNLCLRSIGKSQCENSASRVIKTLTDYLEHDNLQVRMYVHGSLYSLLTRKPLKEQAAAIGLADILEFQKSKSDDITARQIEFVLQRLSEGSDDTGETQSILDDSQSVDGQEDDYEDDDVEADELVTDNYELDQLRKMYPKLSSTSFGVDLIKKQYLLPIASPARFLAEAATAKAQLIQQQNLQQNQQQNLQVRSTHQSSVRASDPALYHMSRPQTPSFSRPHSAIKPSTLEADGHGVIQSQIVRPKLPKPKPTETTKKASTNISSSPDLSEKEVEEYYQAFSTRPKVPRTPLSRF